jgi:hypothetical protein
MSIQDLTKLLVFDKSLGKKEKCKVTKCEHTDADYYALGLCRNCYHTKGRSKFATECPHLNKKLYARSVCKGCYLRIFHRAVSKP